MKLSVLRDVLWLSGVGGPVKGKIGGVIKASELSRALAEFMKAACMRYQESQKLFSYSVEQWKKLKFPPYS